MNEVNKALLVGINHYDHLNKLNGCVADAQAMEKVLSRHDDGSVNFHCKTLTTGNRNFRITEAQLRKEIREFFQGVGDIALFYFSGHGSEDNLGGYLAVQDSEKHSLGISFTELLQVAQQCVEFREIFIILDCCYSGKISPPNDPGPMG
ncbi:MAG TPA: peptidase C14, partial [Cytophagales bacterium]|nr:peptidase C14 [Cytophagales bacterium]